MSASTQDYKFEKEKKKKSKSVAFEATSAATGMSGRITGSHVELWVM